MKQIFITLSFVMASIFGQANDRIGNPPIHTSFEQQFTKAENAAWSQVEDLVKAAFILDGRATSAFYNTSGELVAVTRTMSITELPDALVTGLRKEMNEGWLSELFVMTTQDGESFFANIETSGSKTVLQSVNGKKWSTLNGKEK